MTRCSVKSASFHVILKYVFRSVCMFIEKPNWLNALRRLQPGVMPVKVTETEVRGKFVVLVKSSVQVQILTADHAM